MSELILKPSHISQGFDLIFESLDGVNSIWFRTEEQAREHVDFMNRDGFNRFTIKVIR